MEVNFFTTAVSGSNFFNDAADFCLSPVRLLSGEERSYHVIKDVNGQVEQAIVDEVALRSYGVVRTIFAVLLGVTVLPVMIGFAFKCVALICGSYADYQGLERLQPGVYLESNGLSVVPTVAKPQLDEGDAEINAFYSLDKFLEHWDKVGKGRGNFYRERVQLQTWLQNVTQPQVYWGTDDQQGASDQVVMQLKLILREFDKNISEAKKQKVLLDIIEKSYACPPTWVEFTSAIYLNFMAGDFEDYVLRQVQQFKENIVLQYVQGVGLQWHSINAVRALWGSAYGLRTENLQHDQYYCVIDACCMLDFADKFYAGYRIDYLVTYLEEEMHIDTQQHADLIKCLTAAVAKDQPDKNGSDLDTYVKETYFHPFKGDLTKTREYQSFDAQIAEAEKQVAALPKQLKALDADTLIEACEAVLSAANPGWQQIVADQQALSAQIAELRALLTVEAPAGERARIVQEQARLNRANAGKSLELHDLVDNEDWRAAVNERERLISERTMLLTALRRAEKELEELPQTRDDMMKEFELENRRLINQAGVVRLLIELGLATVVQR